MAVHDKQNPERQHGGSLNAAISNAIVGIVREYTGRGPTKAHTSIRDRTVLVMLEDTLTKGERTLVARGRENKVLEFRGEFQGAMRAEASAAVAKLTGRTVVAMLSANHIEPDLGAEVFVLDAPPERDTTTSHEPDAGGAPGSTHQSERPPPDQ